MRACFKNRPVRGPGLQWGQNRPVSCSPRALTRHFRGFLKYALKRMRTETRRGIDRLIPPLHPRAGHTHEIASWPGLRVQFPLPAGQGEPGSTAVEIRDDTVDKAKSSPSPPAAGGEG